MIKVRGRAYDGTAYGNTSAEIRYVVDEDHAVGAHGTRIELYTTPVTTATLTKVMTIQEDGNINIEAGKEYQIDGVPVGGGSIGTGTAGQVIKWGAAGDTLVDAALIPPATNILTLTATAASTLGLAITAGKTLTLTATDNFNLTIPATGTAALLGTANVFTTTQTITPGTNVVGLIINKSATANSLET